MLFETTGIHGLWTVRLDRHQDERGSGHAQPTVTDVLSVIETGPDTLRSAARADDPARYARQVQDLVFTLDLLCSGSLAGVFDGTTTHPIDLDAPAGTSRPAVGRGRTRPRCRGRG